MLDVAIFGSCVSRDAVGYFPDTLHPAHYTARQAWVSANSRPAWTPPIDRLKSPFQRRMLRDDFHSTLYDRIRSEAPKADLVLLDIVDDRLGVIEYFPRRFVTLSVELSNSGWLAGDRVFGRNRLHLGDDQHFMLFRAAAKRVKDQLIAVKSWEKAYLIKAPYARETVEGDALAGDYGIPVAEWDARYARYYDELDLLGYAIVEPRSELVMSSREHKWGPHGIHYQRAASEDIIRQVLARRASG